MAAREGDGAIINWLSAEDVTKVAAVVREHSGGVDKEIVARIFVCPSEDADAVRTAAEFAIAAYLNVPVYAAFHDWLGRGPALQGMWDAWKAGRPQGGARRDPRRGRRSADRPRLAGGLPRRGSSSTTTTA